MALRQSRQMLITGKLHPYIERNIKTLNSTTRLLQLIILDLANHFIGISNPRMTIPIEFPPAFNHFLKKFNCLLMLP